MSGDSRAGSNRWAARPARAAPPAHEGLYPALQVARAPPNSTGRGQRGQASSTLTPQQVRAAARAASRAAATAPHSRREQANMRAALTVARELLRCRLMESGRDALLERVAELLDAAASEAPPFCYRLSPQATAGPHGRPHHNHVPSATTGGSINISTTSSVGGSAAPMPPATSVGASVAPTVLAGCHATILRTTPWAEQHGAWGTTARCSG